ncbi:VOC family protein [Desulfobotulus sp. H1]|uniref:VOC family protein n=1 Tax=Desulfobotulus pelophilus TaxID=2823377 RepID=A0ABT3N8F4_9BACT|nr:VOC family protein [Desulfobotulus pelophilus]MCW7753732.1 VOC family protein [Desulfobotulus pelophilus]
MNGSLRFTGIHHLAMATCDLNGTIVFWRDLVGLPLFLGFGRQGYRQYFFSISDNCALSFFEWPDTKPLIEKDHGVPVAGPFAFDHVAIGLEGSRDLALIKARFEAAGIWMSEAVDHGFVHSVYTFDPNNIAVEFSVSIMDSELRCAPVLVEKNPPSEVLRGPFLQPERYPEPSSIPDPVLYPGEGKDILP